MGGWSLGRRVAVASVSALALAGIVAGGAGTARAATGAALVSGGAGGGRLRPAELLEQRERA